MEDENAFRRYIPYSCEHAIRIWHHRSGVSCRKRIAGQRPNDSRKLDQLGGLSCPGRDLVIVALGCPSFDARCRCGSRKLVPGSGCKLCSCFRVISSISIRGSCPLSYPYSEMEI